MPKLPPGQNYNAVWRFHCNAKTREYALTVCYYSNDPPAKHETIHADLRQKAFDWLLRNGHSPDPDRVKIEFRRFEELENKTPEVEKAHNQEVVPVVDTQTDEEEKKEIQVTVGTERQDAG